MNAFSSRSHGLASSWSTFTSPPSTIVASWPSPDGGRPSAKLASSRSPITSANTPSGASSWWLSERTRTRAGSGEVVFGVRSDARHDRVPGDPARDLPHVVVGDRVERLDRLVGGADVSERDLLAGRSARHGAGRLECEDRRAGGVCTGAVDLAVARAVRCHVLDDLAYARVGLDALGGVETRRHVQCRRVGVSRAVRADRVTEAALLPDLVEEPRSHRAAEERGVHGERRALLDVGGVDRRAPVQAQV